MIVDVTKHPLRSRISAKQDCDATTAALLFWLWKTGQLRSYPLNKKVWPDNDKTACVLSAEVLKLKLRSDLRRGGSWTARISNKTMTGSMTD